MASTDVEIGDRIESTWEIEFSEDQAPADPPVVLFLVRRPDGTEVKSVYDVADQTYPITRVSAGVYRAAIPIAMKGQRWARRWNAYDENGSPMGADEKTIEVQQTEFTTPLPSA